MHKRKIAVEVFQMLQPCKLGGRQKLVPDSSVRELLSSDPALKDRQLVFRMGKLSCQ